MNARYARYARGVLHMWRGDRTDAAEDFAHVKNGEHAWNAHFLRAFRGDPDIVPAMLKAVETDKSRGSPVSAAAVLAMLQHPPGPRRRRAGAGAGGGRAGAGGGAKHFTNPVVRADFLTRRELDPLTELQDFQALLESAAALDRGKCPPRRHYVPDTSFGIPVSARPPVADWL